MTNQSLSALFALRGFTFAFVSHRIKKTILLVELGGVEEQLEKRRLRDGGPLPASFVCSKRANDNEKCNFYCCIVMHS
jgi:hypothetical protein